MTASSLGARSKRSPKASRTSGTAYATRPKRAGDDGVDDVAEDARHAPPLAGGDDDGERDEGEPDAVAAVLRLEVAALSCRRGAPRRRPGARRPSRCRGSRVAAAGARRSGPCDGAAGGRLARRRAAAAARRLARRRHTSARTGATTWRTIAGPWSERYAKVTSDSRVTRAPAVRRGPTRPSAAASSQIARGLSSCWTRSRGRRYPREHGHECQRTAPACWPATLLRGGVLRVTTRPLGIRAGRQARTC